MKMKKITLICLLGAALQATAQENPNDSTLTRTVVVEHEYAPEIEDARKIDILPPVAPPAVSKKEVAYDLQQRPVVPYATTLSRYDAPEAPARPLPGYVRAGMGNRGRLDLLGRYRARLSDTDRLSLHLLLDGLKSKDDRADGEWNRHDYHTQGGLSYEHDFQGYMLDAAAHLGLRNFNVLPILQGSPLRNQRFTSGDLHLGFRSTDPQRSIQFKGETNLLFYNRAHESATESIGETAIRTLADVSSQLPTEGMRVGLAVQMDNYFYNRPLIDNRTDLSLNPYFALEQGDWQLRAGLRTDWAMGSGKTFYAAPDLRASYRITRRGQLYLQATGGKLANDFRRIERINPYLYIEEEPLRSTYEQLNAALGLRISPTDGVWLHLYGGMQMLTDDLGFRIDPDLTSSAAPAREQWQQGKTRNIYGGGELLWDYRSLVKLNASLLYRSWKDVDDLDLLFYKPTLDARVQIDFTPLTALDVHIGYHHQQREEAAQAASELKPDPISNLYAGATYQLWPGISLYVQADNLLNKKYQATLCSPQEGITLLGGVVFRF